MATREYLVAWYIEIEADSFEAAAKRALEIQRNPESTATVFDVEDLTSNQTMTLDLGDSDARH